MRTRHVVLVAALVCAVQTAHADWRFIVAGDSRADDNTAPNNGVNVGVLGQLAYAMAAENPDLVLFTGDLVNDGSKYDPKGASQFQTWKTAMSPLYGAGINVYPVRGNHDLDDGGHHSVKTNWVNAFGATIPDNGKDFGEENLSYSFSHKEAFFVGLDTYVTSEQINQSFVDAQFAANTLPLVFVFGHDPAFKVGSHADTLDDHPAQRDTFWRSLAAEGAHAYFAGHDHFYDHARLDDKDGNVSNDVHQYIVGTAGAPFTTGGPRYDGVNSVWAPINVDHEESNYGYAVVDIMDSCTPLPTCATATLTYKHLAGPIPEPSTSVMLSAGLALVGLMGIRRRSAAGSN